MKAAIRILSPLPSDGMRFRRRSIAAAAAALFALPGAAGAATINVAGACIFRDAIIAANNDAAQGSCTAGSGADIIVLPVAATITAGAAIPSITSEITIQGRGSILQRNTAVANFRVLTVTATGNLTVEDLTIRNGRLGEGQGRGGAVLVTGGALTLTRSTVSGNTAFDGGGGIAMNGGYLKLQHSTISGNDATSDNGGGIFADSDANLLLIASTVSGNLAGREDLVNYDQYGYGAGIYHAGAAGGFISLKYSTVSGNSAHGGGGGIFSRAQVSLSNSQVTGNTAAYSGGGVYTDAAQLSMKYSSVSNNTGTDGDGGGIKVSSQGSAVPGILRMTNSTVAGNRADDGAGVEISFDTTASIDNSTISGNTASRLGGGLAIENRGSASIRNSTITGNTALGTASNFGYGGGIVKPGLGLLTLERNIISGNSTPNSGIGQEISLQAPYATLENNGYNLLGSAATTSAQAFRNFAPVASDRTATSNGTHPTVIGNILGTGPAAIGGPTLAFNTRGVSPARDFIPSALCEGEVDQRGVVRPKDGVNGLPNVGRECDAGAVESAGFNAVDLSLAMTSNGPVLVGEPLTYSLTVRNDGADPANGIEVYDSLPPGLSLVSAISNNFIGDCSLELGTVGCRIQRLSPGGSFLISLVTATSTTGPVTNTASFINDTLINTNATGTDFDAAVTTQVFGPTVTLSASPTSIAEAAGVATLRATLSQAVSIPIVVNLGYTGTADLSDSTRPASITVPAGALSATATVTATQDTLDEDNETVIASISSVPNGTIAGTGSATVTIVDDDAPPNIGFFGATQTVDEAAGTVTVRMNMSAISGRAVSVPLSFTGTASNGTDYSPSAATISVPAGSSTGAIMLALTNDTLDEANETVIVTAGTATNAVVVIPNAQTVTITDNDAPPTVTLNASPLSIAEAAGVSTLTATLSAASSFPVTVNLAYTGTAGAGDSTRPASITIPAGSLSATATVTATQDALDEANETVIVDISTVTNATESGTQQRTITIVDDDNAPTVTLAASPLSIAEAAGVSTLTATLSAVSSLPVTVNLAYTGTAGIGDSTRPASITIAAGSLSGTATVTATQDTLDENDETLVVDISTVTNATESGTQQSTITIVDDDGAPTVTLAASPLSIAEAAGVSTLTATLSAASSQPVTVNLAYSGTAGTGDSSRPASISIPAGSLSGTATVTATQDAIDEDDETLIVDISTVTNATESGTQQSSITVLDDDAAPTIAFFGAVQNVGEDVGTVTVRMNLSALSERTVTVPLSFGGGASNPDDYTASAATITVPAGSNTGTITLDVVNDSVFEGSEAVVVTAGSPSNAVLGSPDSQTITIADNDEVPDTTPDAFSFADVSNVDPGSSQLSSPIQVTGISASTSISVSGGSYGLNGDPCIQTSGTVFPNDVVRVCHTASANFLTATNTTLTIGADGVLLGVSDTFTSTTRNGDTTPDKFRFLDVDNVPVSTVQTSDSVIITGLEGPSPISVSGGEYSIGCDANGFTTGPGLIAPGASVCVRHTSSAGAGKATRTVLVIGGVQDTFTSTTTIDDITPDSFSFIDVGNVPLNTVVVSNTVTITGMSGPGAISITGGQYSIGCLAGGFTREPGTIDNGQTVCVQNKSSNRYKAASSAKLTIGGVSDSFTTTTIAAP